MTEQHQKPTQEELDQKMQEALESLEVEDQKEVKTEEESKEEEVEQETEEVEEEVTPSEEEKEVLKKRYQDSSREALTLYSKNKKIAEAIEKAGEVQVTEEELRAKYSEWEMMTEHEKTMARESLEAKKGIEAIREATREFKQIDAWNGRVDEFLVDPKTLIVLPDLEGKEEDFKTFASKENRRGADLTDLANLFVLTEAKSKVKNKGSMMPTGTAGADKSKKSDGKMSLSEARVLRTQNYKAYISALKAGRISEEV